MNLEDRKSNKISIFYPDNVIRTESFDKVFLYSQNCTIFLDLQLETLQNGVHKSVQSGSVKGLQG